MDLLSLLKNTGLFLILCVGLSSSARAGGEPCDSKSFLQDPKSQTTAVARDIVPMIADFLGLRTALNLYGVSTEMADLLDQSNWRDRKLLTWRILALDPRLSEDPKIQLLNASKVIDLLGLQGDFSHLEDRLALLGNSENSRQVLEIVHCSILVVQSNLKRTIRIAFEHHLRGLMLFLAETDSLKLPKNEELRKNALSGDPKLSLAPVRRSFLLEIASTGNPLLMKRIIRAGAQVNAELGPQEKYYPIHVAANRGDLKAVQILKRFGNQNLLIDPFAGTESLLTLAAKSDSRESVQLMDYFTAMHIHHKAFRKGEFTSLAHATYGSEGPRRVSKLIALNQRGHSLDITADGGGALVGEYSPTEFTELLEHGLDIEEKDDTGKTPLHWQVSYRNLANVRSLIAKYADARVLDKHKMGLLHVAFASYHMNRSYPVNKDEPQGIVPSPDLVEYLVQLGLGSQVNEKSLLGRTPFHLFLKYADYQRVMNQNFLPMTEINLASLSHGLEDLKNLHADFNAQDDDGMSGLHHFLQAHLFTNSVSNSEKAVEVLANFLAQSGANLNLVNRWGQTPLHLVGATFRRGLYNRMVRLGANPKVRDRYDRTPEDYMNGEQPQRWFFTALPPYWRSFSGAN